MTRHKKHDPHDLVDALEHVAYEIWKYKQSVAHYGQILHAGGDAAIEFRVLHHRVLLEFFYGRPKHQDNIVAWEYIHDWQRTQDVKKLTWFDDYMQRCHTTMLAHISKTRSEMAKRWLKDWGNAWQVVEPQLDQTICNFLSGLANDHKDTCLKWVTEWSKGRHPGNDVLASLAAILGRP
jgi:hypothetical protein